MDVEPGYTPDPEFQELAEDSLVDFDLDDSTELWLIQLPEGSSPDFDGQKLSLELNQDGQLGCLEGPSGKVYNLVSYSQHSDAAVFVSSPSGPQIAGKIKKHVSLVHYPDPVELKAMHTDQKQMNRTSMTFTHSTHHTPTRSRMNFQSQSKSRSTTHTSRKSGLSDVEGVSRSSKRNAGEPSRVSDQSGRSSGPARSGTTYSGSSEQSHRKKLKQELD